MCSLFECHNPPSCEVCSPFIPFAGTLEAVGHFIHSSQLVIKYEPWRSYCNSFCWWVEYTIATADFQVVVSNWTLHRFCVMVLSNLHVTFLVLCTTGGGWRHHVCYYCYGGWRTFRGVLHIFSIMYVNFWLLCPTWKLAWSCLITECAQQLQWGRGAINLQRTTEHCNMSFAAVIACVSCE